MSLEVIKKYTAQLQRHLTATKLLLEHERADARAQIAQTVQKL